ncbi:MAG: hypothetical protein ABJA79_07050, partial [Parafilimonas sp.]
MKYLIANAILLFSIQANAQVNNQPSEFLVNPYLQIGKAPTQHSLQLLWHTAISNNVWLAEYLPTRQAGKNNADGWIKSENQTTAKIAVAGNNPFTIYNASFAALTPGTTFTYRVSKNGKVVFSSEAKAPKLPGQPYRFVISGDMGAGTKQSRQIAYDIYNSHPDVVAIAGDIVYSQG